MFKFIKSIFGSGENTDSPLSQNVPTPDVPESVLDRFLLNAKELYYFVPNTNDIALKLTGKQASVAREHPQGSVAVIAVFWLREIYTSNRPLFISVLNRFKPTVASSDEDQRRFLWAHFRTGNTTNQPQLSVFYQRGKSIISFLDAITENWETLLNLNSQDISELANKIGPFKSIKSVDGLTNKDLTLIVGEFMNSLNKTKSGAQSVANNEGSKNDSVNLEQEISTTQVIRPKMPRQQKIKNKGANKGDAYLLLFSASWCGPSKKLVKELNEVGFNRYTYINVDEDWAEDLAVKYEIRNVPTTILLTTDGTVVNKWVGWDDEDPGQTKMIGYINNSGYNIIPFPQPNANKGIGKIMPQKSFSYVVDDNGAPMVVYYRPKSKVFVNRAIGDETVGYFLNIRRPLVIDVANQSQVDIPPIPEECDGIILENYGLHKSKAFIVRDKGTQSMETPL